MQSSYFDVKVRKEREERIAKEMNEWNQRQKEIMECLAKHRSFVAQTIKEALKRPIIPNAPSKIPLPLPVPSLSLSPSSNSPPVPDPFPSIPSLSLSPPSLSLSPSLSPSSPSPPTKKSRRGSVSKSKNQKPPKRPTLLKRENHGTPPSSPLKLSLTREKFENEKIEKNENFAKRETGENNKENEKSQENSTTPPASPQKSGVEARLKLSPLKLLAPRSTWEPTRAPSLSPRKHIPVPEFRTFSPTVAPKSAHSKMITPGDLALFVLRPDASRIQDVKKGIEELNTHMDKLEKIGGMAALLKCGRLCEMCFVTPTSVKGRLRLLFERNLMASLPATKTELQQAMESIDRVHPRSLKGRSRSATWSNLPAPGLTRIKPVLTPITPISVFTPNKSPPPARAHASAPSTPLGAPLTPPIRPRFFAPIFPSPPNKPIPTPNPSPPPQKSTLAPINTLPSPKTPLHIPNDLKNAQEESPPDLVFNAPDSPAEKSMLLNPTPTPAKRVPLLLLDDLPSESPNQI